jgi:hypothetical protein
VLFEIRRVFRGTGLPSESTPYVKNCRVSEPGAAGFGSKGWTPPAPVGIKGSVAARAKGASKEAAVRTAAARTIDGLIRRSDLRRDVFMKEEEGKNHFTVTDSILRGEPRPLHILFYQKVFRLGNAFRLGNPYRAASSNGTKTYAKLEKSSNG